VEEIVLNNDFPRSVLYSVNQLHRYFERLKSERNADGFHQIDFMIGKLKSKIQYTTVDNILKEGLHQYLSDIKESLYEVADSVNQNYFAYT
jgi:uncharacterized alpha-E superfamily protein